MLHEENQAVQQLIGGLRPVQPRQGGQGGVVMARPLLVGSSI